MTKTIPVVAMLLSLLALPGCVIGEIRDELGNTNQQLTDIDEGLTEVERVNELLTDLDAALNDLDQVRLVSLETQLETLEAINTNMELINQRLMTVENSLVETNEHLASLRRTINNIDSTIPFLSISGDDEEDREALDEVAGGEGEPDETASPDTTDTPTPPDGK